MINICILSLSIISILNAKKTLILLVLISILLNLNSIFYRNISQYIYFYLDFFLLIAKILVKFSIIFKFFGRPRVELWY